MIEKYNIPESNSLDSLEGIEQYDDKKNSNEEKLVQLQEELKSATEKARQYERLYKILLKKIKKDGTKHVYDRSYRDRSSMEIEKNVAIGDIVSKFPKMNSKDHARLLDDLNKL